MEGARWTGTKIGAPRGGGHDARGRGPIESPSAPPRHSLHMCSRWGFSYDWVFFARWLVFVCMCVFCVYARVLCVCPRWLNRVYLRHCVDVRVCVLCFMCTRVLFYGVYAGHLCLRKRVFSVLVVCCLFTKVCVHPTTPPTTQQDGGEHPPVKSPAKPQKNAHLFRRSRDRVSDAKLPRRSRARLPSTRS